MAADITQFETPAFTETSWQSHQKSNVVLKSQTSPATRHESKKSSHNQHTQCRKHLSCRTYDGFLNFLNQPFLQNVLPSPPAWPFQDKLIPYNNTYWSYWSPFQSTRGSACSDGARVLSVLLGSRHSHFHRAGADPLAVDFKNRSALHFASTAEAVEAQRASDLQALRTHFVILFLRLVLLRFVSLFPCLFVCLFVCLYVRVFVCLLACVCVCVSFCVVAIMCVTVLNACPDLSVGLQLQVVVVFATC